MEPSQRSAMGEVASTSAQASTSTNLRRLHRNSSGDTSNKRSSDQDRPLIDDFIASDSKSINGFSHTLAERWDKLRVPVKVYRLILMAIICILSLTLLTYYPSKSGSTFYRSSSLKSQPSPKTKYSGTEAGHGVVWFLNTHQIRRQRQKRSSDSGTERKQSSSESRARVTGLAKSCGHSCNFRLKSDVLNHDSHAIESQRELVIYFERWRQISKPQTNQTDSESKVVPLVQYMDAEDRTHARFSTVSPDCLYSAAVLGSAEKGIVNLCEKHGGLFGTLVLEDGAYMIEPIERKEYRNHQERTQQDLSADEPDNSNETSNEEDTVDENSLRRRRSLSIDLRPHLIFRAPRQSFEHPISDHSTNETVDDYTYENTTEWVDTNRRSERSRRSANSWDHFVEVLVVADFKMLLYHQGNLEAYILTLFSTVASIYRHPTLRASINIIVVRIIILKHERAGPMISNRAQETLQQFCAWQQNYNDPNDDALSHHDVAILLTRHDICRATNKCDTLGLAELGTMCDGQRSCAIIEDNGLSAAFTIAHELGHIFNIPHDDERKCAHYMQLNKHNYHIMAPTLEYNTHPWSWSACSSAMLSKFLDDSRAQTQCILDQPIERKYYDKMFENPAPGAKYSVDQQCQFVFGANAEICPYMPTCRRLWCSTYVGYQMGCRTQHMPWADGTPCGDSKWCHRGQCVGMAPNQRSKQDGSWGEWREWEDCSRTCGGGIQKALRDCDSPKPSNGGKYCVGQRERYRPCNIQECPWDTLGFREMQCAEFDNTNVGIHGVPLKTSWVPKYSGVSRNERCKLYCRVKDSQAFYLLKDRVMDGTPCDQNGDDICIDGTCHAAGCDHRLGSPMRRDVCGICGGDGSTCQTVEGVFNERGSFGYNEVLKIPAGSANIDIKQNAYNHNKDDDNYLALRASNGEFLLNGQYQVSVFRQQISVQDTVLEYSGSDHSVERINGTGPIRSDIYLHVLSVGNLNPPDIHYKYMVPRENSPVHRPSAQFYWRFSDQYTECSKICQGTQFRVLHCVDATSNRQTHDGHCTSRKPDPEERMCNIDCSIKWRTKDVSGCSARCGHGEKQQESICIRTSSRRREETIAEHECTRSGLAKPPTRIRCYADCTGRQWSYTDWSQCTATCGNTGISRRVAMCVDDNRNRLDDRHCESISKETLEQECNRIPCPRWNYGTWSECSRSCDGGVRIRHAQCQSAAGQDLPSHLCNAAERDDRQKCNENVCTSWKFGSWSECSASCGTGTQTRTAECQDSWGRKMDDARCEAHEHIVSKPCKKIDCPHWEMSSWSACSVSCQDGWMTRAVYCVDTHGKKIRDEFCTRTDPVRPPSHQVCNHGPCPFWRHGDWSRCSVTCGFGVRYRDIECIFRDETVDKSLCQKSQQPKEHETCKLLPCTHWRTNPWSSCSVTCGVGVQLRTVTCMPDDYSHEALEDRHCEQHLKPRTERPCERKCPIDAAGNTIQNQQSQIYWATGPWTDCSASCDNGTQMRQVVCHDHIRQLPDEYCRHIEKEQNKRNCNVKPCTMWSVGSWAECPATCGVQHIQRRSVVCTDLGGKPLNETACEATSQPESERNCGLPACPSEPKPIIGIWSTGDWAKCSVSCGGGWRRRTVSCDEDVCDEKVKPSQFERCNEQNCTKAAWQITPWSPCSVSCGDKGLQERKIWCQEDINSTQRLPDAECVKHEPKPSMRRGCARRACPDKNLRIATNSIKPNTTATTTNRLYNWHTADWNPVRTKRPRLTPPKHSISKRHRYDTRYTHH
uniref:Peptidase M12B domain-containing protein n=1 Tax=Panagrellus redivivus TaxID=6233 RepID=A0A7E4W1Q7_PANRE